MISSKLYHEIYNLIALTKIYPNAKSSDSKKKRGKKNRSNFPPLSTTFETPQPPGKIPKLPFNNLSKLNRVRSTRPSSLIFLERRSKRRSLVDLSFRTKERSPSRLPSSAGSDRPRFRQPGQRDKRREEKPRENEPPSLIRDHGVK